MKDNVRTQARRAAVMAIVVAVAVLAVFEFISHGGVGGDQPTTATPAPAASLTAGPAAS